MFKNKTVILGITGSIAAYKMANVASQLVKQHCDVHVIMTKNATEFISPLVFETLTNNRCIVDMFDRGFQYNVEHVSLAKCADLFVVAPASANVIAKLAYGMADDMLTTTYLACQCTKIISPAMNTHMYENKVVQNNIEILRGYGAIMIEPSVGMLACKDVGAGKFPDEEVILGYIEREIAYEKDMSGKKVLVTAGPTCEAIDPVRYITNHSSGKMGYAVAKACMLRGAEVTLVSGRTSLPKPSFIKVIDVFSAQNMADAVIENCQDCDIILKAAAVADFRPKSVGGEKMKKSGKDEISIELSRTTDILEYLGTHRPKEQFICGFSMETQNMIENSQAKLERKHIDMIVANNIKDEGAGFRGDTNVMTIITNDSVLPLPKMSKTEVAHAILDQILGKTLDK